MTIAIDDEGGLEEETGGGEGRRAGGGALTRGTLIGGGLEDNTFEGGKDLGASLGGSGPFCKR